jgi:malate dehydrogenase (oxaloacetate-decarboxylating)
VNGKPFTTDQTNNAYVFPGVGLGALAVSARRVTDNMFAAAARALAGASPSLSAAGANLLPPVRDLRKVAVVVATAVARQAREDGVCARFEDQALAGLIAAKMWEPVYRPYRRKA